MTAHLLLHATHVLSVHVAASPTPPSLSGISGASDHPAAKPFYDAALAGLLQVLRVRQRINVPILRRIRT